MKSNPFRTLDNSVYVNGSSVAVNTDFRMGVAIEIELLSEEPDVAGLLAAFYADGITHDVQAAVRAMLDFYVGPSTPGEVSKQPRRERWYDFIVDADVLYASFRAAYGLDLSNQNLHWWMFRDLMQNLPQESAFMRRVHYRVADISKLGKDEKDHYAKMKRLYRIDSLRRLRLSREERDTALLTRVNARFETAKALIESGEG